MRLIIKYEYNGPAKVTEVDEICKVRDGFWIDKDGEFCLSKDSHKYVMPHMIKEIRKIQEKQFEEVEADGQAERINE